MRSLAHLLRLLPLAAAALASVATSPMFSTLEIEAASPAPDESAVPADAVLTLRVHVIEGSAPSGNPRSSGGGRPTGGSARRGRPSGGR